MSDLIQPTYEEVAIALRSLKALSEPSESHALLCALFSAGADVRLHAWVDSMLSGPIEEGDIRAHPSMLEDDDEPRNEITEVGEELTIEEIHKRCKNFVRELLPKADLI